ncbi:MAG: ATP-binding cassette domain-containing protein [Bacteroidota bacterium]
MSELLLKAIIQLFAIVAKEDDITTDERDQIRDFLLDNLNEKKVPGYMSFFDDYSTSVVTAEGITIEKENTLLKEICDKINQELTQKQKIVIIIELMVIITADEQISVREEELFHEIGQSFNLTDEEISLIQLFVKGQAPEELQHKNILIFGPEREKNNTIYRHCYRKGLMGFMVVLFLQKEDIYFVKYLGDSELYLNGIPLKFNKPRVFSTGSSIRSDRDIIRPIYFGDAVSRLSLAENITKIAFHAEDISYRFGNGKLGIRNINISEEQGRLIGLMGASGAGKSTLLNVLNGTDKPSSGTVKINGIDIHEDKDQVQGVIGFVPQDDLLIEDLTVYQNLYYSAKLCFSNLSEEETQKLVDKTLYNLGLFQAKDLKVGSPLEKTISGGQRKRLNIGLELLREPSVLFVDEPTSGLSSRDSENIMDLLKELTLKGKLIFVVIHQPSSDIFKMFNKLVVLDVGGYQIYYGNPIDAVIYFKKVINFLNSELGECTECGNINPEQIFNIIETRVVDEFGRFTAERKISPEQWHKLFLENIDPSKTQQHQDKPSTTLRIPSEFKQFKIFSIRDVLSKLSNRQYLIINFLEGPLLAAILAYIVRYFHMEEGIEVKYLFSKNINIPAYFFMSIIVALFMGLTVSAEEIFRDRKILKREVFLNLSRRSYLLSKIIILFSLSAVQTLTFVLVGNSILGVPDIFIGHWLILFSVSCFANVLGLNISSAFNSAVTIYILIPILLIPQLILSGVVVRFDRLNPNLSSTDKVPVIGELMASRWAFEGLMVSQFKDNDFESQFYEFDKSIAQSEYKRLYYLPTLESKLDFCLNHHATQDEEMKQLTDYNLNLLQTELDKELEVVGEEQFPQIDMLAMGKFDSTIFQTTSRFLTILKQYYTNIQTTAQKDRDDLLNSLTSTEETTAAYEKLRKQHYNERIAEMVKNQNDPQRIIEMDGSLIRKVSPIFMYPEPKHLLDFRAQFYVPTKHFLGNQFDTLWFNIGIIWLMTLVLIATLYLDLLKKLVNTSIFNKQYRKLKRTSPSK